LREKYGIGQFFRAGPNVIETDAGESMTLKLAHAWVGDTWYEIVEPVAGAVSVYTDWLPSGNAPLRFHHAGIRLRDVAAWDRMVRESEAAGYRMVLSLTKNRAQKYGFLDTMAELGHFVEYLYIPDPRQTAFMPNMPQNIAGAPSPIDSW
jgi:hypothetical protein